MKTIISMLPFMDLNEKSVFLRADLNVPLHNGKVSNDFKLKAIQPTLDFLLKKKAHIVLATHLGRPEDKEQSLSTKQLIPWFEKRDYTITFAKNPHEAAQQVNLQKKGFLLLENLRFFPGEKKRNSEFAHELKNCGQIYVNDAFGTLHRKDTSIILLPQLYKKEYKTIGLLIEKELKHLRKLIDNPTKPFVIILGGGKIETKLSFIKALLEKVDSLLLCPALVFTLLKALGKPVGRSLVDITMLNEMKKLWELPITREKLILPLDYQIILKSDNKSIKYVTAENFPQNALGSAIGPKTIEEFSNIIKNAKTIFFNAAMGFADIPETMQATQQLLKDLGKSEAYTVIGGGDSVSAAFTAGVAEKIDFLSTGGGATLAYLSGQTLPGLSATCD